MSIDPQRILGLLQTDGSRLHTLLTRIVLRDDVAEDLMQELFLNLARSAAFGRADDPAAYAYRVAVHLAFRWRRRQRRLAPGFDEATELTAETDSPPEKVIREEELQQVLSALDRLSQTSRDIVVMRYLRQESYERIAEELGKTPHQVRGLCAKAISRLRAMVNRNQNSPSTKEMHCDRR